MCFSSTLICAGSPFALTEHIEVSFIVYRRLGVRGLAEAEWRAG